MLGKSQAKYIQSLGQKKVRDSEGVFIAEGSKIISELLAMPGSGILKLYAVHEWIQANTIHATPGDVIEVNETDLAKISQLSTPNKVLAVVKKQLPVKTFQLKGQVSLVLDTIQDPGNMGTIIRIADWFGIKQVIASHNCADMYNPKVVQSTMGSILRVKVLYTDLEHWLAEHQEEVKIYATALEGEDVRTMNRIDEGLIIIGNESKGINPEIMKLVNTRITIPRIGGAESLNAAVATGIILSHLR